MPIQPHFRIFIGLMLFFLGIGQLAAQQITRISGTVSDAVTGETLPYANVSLLPANMGVGAMTDNDGKYILDIKAKGESIRFSYVGYEPMDFALTDVKNGILNARLKPLATQLDAVTVTATRTRYRNRDNPAVELIRKAIDNKDKNRIEAKSSYEYHRYEKILLSMNELNDSIKNGVLFRNFPFLNNYIDTVPQTGRLLLPVFLRENISEHYFRQSPQAEKEFLIASQIANFHDLIEQETINVFMDGIVGKSNIYDNRIMVLENEYLSPLAPLAPNFYRFHILDTTLVSGTSCIQLSVYPRNPQDFGFRGNLYLTNDSAYALKRAELTFTENANINFVNHFSMIQEYTMTDNVWCLTLDEVTIDFSFTKSKNMLLGKRTNVYTDYRFDHYISDNTFNGVNKVVKLPGYDQRAGQYWEEYRPVPLLRSEQGVYDMLVDMKNDKWFNRALHLFGIAFSGYIDAGKFDIGPMSTLYSFNDVEGSRVRIGGKTNARFNKHFFLEGYGAYGFKDKKFKYQAGAMYSFSERKLHPWEYPMNLLSLSYEDNIETPGQFFQFGSPDRLFLSFHRGHAQQMVYHRTFSAKYDKEYLSGFSFQPSLIHKEERPAGNMTFTNDYGDVHDITTSQLGLQVRFAPNERFYQIQHNRFPLNHTHPVFTVNYHYGMNGVWNGDYEFHRLEAGIDKRSWFASLGFFDMWLKAGKIWGTVPFPLLIIHQANQNYAYQDEAFNMMNYMEFVSDQYAMANLSHCFNGWIFNRVPLIKKLKWREFITFKALWGNLSESNRPENNPDLLHFPVNRDGAPATYALGKTPYMEASVAVDNVFKFLRIDLVKRLNYLDHPDIPEWGVRFRLRFVF
ncbi:MAG: DUF5686 and carboxypeptidase regulatory-like domain-containing protein [Bacteroidales bacterium]|jgi:hypothetical protein|nr:DUF5686 and carboxypeptidase regulatory-like domain-containing protein [Bacteroidales bacterium]